MASTDTLTPPIRPNRVRWGRRDWAETGAYTAVLVLMHVVGFGVLLLVIQPAHLSVGNRVFGVGLGVTAYVFGLRHAFDADHIAAIDNTTRKLMMSGQRPKSVGFWFAIGHSAMVFIMTVLVWVGAGLAARLSDDDSRTHEVLGTIGTVTSASFLFLIGAINLVALAGLWRMWRAMRQGTFDESELERHLASRGVLARLLGRLGRSISRPWQMVPLGMLFGLGFDTASEVALLVLAGSSAAAGLPWYAVLVLPLLFAAGMSTLDFLDGLFMTVAYDWAFASPARKIYYNLLVTALSVTVALVVGAIQASIVLRERVGLHDPVTGWLSSLDLGQVGVVVVGLFILVWAVAMTYWRYGGVEERWAARAGAE